ncbi:MAG TPA: EamA family transporter [Candidatus Saccharimonadales bacterium]|nr:EamA family transporter [Candidatus Saccharimonadales bacterium]
MSWLGLALFAAFLLATTNFIETLLLTKLTHDQSAVTLTILGGIASIPFVLVFALIARDQLWHFGLCHAAAALFAGLLLIMAYYLYFRSLALADMSLVSALFQLVIVFNFAFGLLWLHEHLNWQQLAGVGIIIVGAVTLNLEMEGARITFKRQVFFLMCAASILIALSNVIFKTVAKETSYLPTQFFEYAAAALASLFLLAVHRRGRAGFMSILRGRGHLAFGLSAFNEVVTLGAVMAMSYAFLLAPIAIVQAAMSTQAVYLVVFGFICTRWFPQLLQENISRNHLLYKFASIAIIVAGTIVLAI